MKQVIFILTVLFPAALNSFGQHADTSYYSSGQPRDIRFFRHGKIYRVIAFKPSGDIRYEWDIEKKRFESFDSFTYTDTLTTYFIDNCPAFTLYQHYGNGPLMQTENYRDGVRHGPSEQYARDGRLIARGQFEDWGKSGIWTYYDLDGESDRHIHWFHHTYYQGGISIDNTIIPVIVTLMAVALGLLLFLRYFSFPVFLISYSLFVIALFIVIYLMEVLLSREALMMLGRYTGKYFFPVLTTLIVSKLMLSTVTLIFKAKTGVSRKVSSLFLILGLGLSVWLLRLYVLSKLSGMMIM